MSGKGDSVFDEPQFQPQRRLPPAQEGVPNAAETPRGDDWDAIRDGAVNEPFFAGKVPGETFPQWLARKEAGVSADRAALACLAAGLVGGCFAIVGAFLAHLFGVRGSGFGLFYLCAFGPASEELLKVSGLIFLLEKRPYLVRSGPLLLVAGLLAALVFASVENVIYTRIYVVPDDVRNWSLFVGFRWIVCTLLHVSCSLIAALGLLKAWRLARSLAVPFSMETAYPLLVSAIVFHGFYNFAAWRWLEPFLTP